MNSIQKFAERENVLPTIVAGRLMNDKLIDFNRSNALRKKYNWA